MSGAAAPRDPHLDENILVWSDAYCGRYQPPPGDYGGQFDEKWRLVLDDATGDKGFNQGFGARTDDQAIECLVRQWTGIHPRGADAAQGCRPREIDGIVEPALIRHLRCIDVGCGSGRWTRVMQALGAKEVLSVDASEHSLRSVKRFNPAVLAADVLALPAEHPELIGAFDFANLWGVAQHTHDPRAAFLSTAGTVNDGGSMYLMVYAPEGHMNTPLVNHYRRTFRRLPSFEQRLAFIDAILERRWHSGLPLGENLRGVARRLLRRPTWGVRVGLLDTMTPFYNWTIPLDVAIGWFTEAGFADVTVLNEGRTRPVAHHLLGTRKGAARSDSL